MINDGDEDNEPDYKIWGWDRNGSTTKIGTFSSFEQTTGRI